MKISASQINKPEMSNLHIHRRAGCEPEGSPKEFHLFYYEEGTDPLETISIMTGTYIECTTVKEFIAAFLRARVLREMKKRDKAREDLLKILENLT